MKKYPCLLTGMALAALTLSACGNSNNTETSTTIVDSSKQNAEISIAPFDNPSPEYPNATLTIKDWEATVVGDTATVTINYNVANYELKLQTPDATTKGCNNSKDGQHIHFILNNGPYVALYEPTHTFNVKVDEDVYVLSFLSRSYHESLKNKEAALLLRFKVDKNGKIAKLDIPATPMVFFSRPKGDYVGQVNTENILLDYYLWNTDLSSQNLKVKADINNQTFHLDNWQPMMIKYAPMGELKITLSLIDSTGAVLEGVNTSVSRTSNLAVQEPIK